MAGSGDMHVSFDDYNWALLPTKEDLEAVVAFDDSRAGNLRAPSHYLQDGLLRSEQTLPNRIWNYHLVLFRPQHTMILRLGTNPGSYVVHQYPFETLGLLQSHVHPLYVVYNVGKKVHDILDPVWNVKSDYKLPQQHITSLHKLPQEASPTAGLNVKQEMSGFSEETRPLQHKTPCHWCSVLVLVLAWPLTSDQYLPIPESMPSVDCERRLETISSETSFSSLHWANPDDWAAGVESSVREDPQFGGTERARKALVEYSRDSEVARVAPQGPWEEWTPAYDFF
ncbi:hypothetical protein RSOL_077020, partial [Rhizoctonia solani AG-3 Rhs1AP]